MRDLAVVLDNMINEIPSSEGDLIDSLMNVRENILYTAPEALWFRFCDVAVELDRFFPNPNALNEWQQKVVKIWMDENQ